MISKIVMNGIASYKHETVLETDKKTNLIYGLNGTGKSTLSDYLYNIKDSKFSECSIEGLEDFDEIVVYNQQFINDNFYESEDIQGIFTLSKENSQAKIAIDKAKVDIEKTLDTQRQKKEEKKKIQTELEKRKNEASEKTWEIKVKHTGGDRIFEYCLDGLKGNKNTLYQYISALPKSEEFDITVDEIKKQVQTLQGDARSAPLLSKMVFDMKEIETSSIFKKEIVGNKNSSVSEVIEKLRNSDWVKTGLSYVHTHEGDITCPFCQANTLSEELVKNINLYFDVSYQNDIDEINDNYIKYKNTYESLTNKETYTECIFATKYQKDFELVYTRLVQIIESNLELMKQKAKNPSFEVSIQTTIDVLEEANEIIKNINKDIAEYNKKIENKNLVLNELKKKFWLIMCYSANYMGTVINFVSLVKKGFSLVRIRYE